MKTSCPVGLRQSLHVISFAFANNPSSPRAPNACVHPRCSRLDSYVCAPFPSRTLRCPLPQGTAVMACAPPVEGFSLHQHLGHNGTFYLLYSGYRMADDRLVGGAPIQLCIKDKLEAKSNRHLKICNLTH